MTDRLHKSIYGQTLDEMKEDKGAWEYKQDYICDTCKHNDKEWDEEPCDGCCGNHSGYEPSGDVISRQAVLDGVDRYIYKSQSTGTQDDFYSFAELVVKALPSVNPQEPCSNCCNGNQIEKAKLCQKSYLAGMKHRQEPKTGHWINDEDTIGVYYCSECGGYVSSYDDAYCKYCGAKMVEPQERSDKE